jgi:hypothetical protein
LSTSVSNVASVVFSTMEYLVFFGESAARGDERMDGS